MSEYRAEHSVRTLYRVLRVSPQRVLYGWRKRGPSRRDREDAKLTEEIRSIHEWSRGT